MRTLDKLIKNSAKIILPVALFALPVMGQEMKEPHTITVENDSIIHYDGLKNRTAYEIETRIHYLDSDILECDGMIDPYFYISRSDILSGEPTDSSSEPPVQWYEGQNYQMIIKLPKPVSGEKIIDAMIDRAKGSYFDFRAEYIDGKKFKVGLMSYYPGESIILSAEMDSDMKDKYQNITVSDYSWPDQIEYAIQTTLPEFQKNIKNIATYLEKRLK